ncbi:SLOG family protein [Nocardia sp. NPDC058640]|uniref:SLOG family protein n=1 Tax=Nocardia sp. NPDC058640 TaxID=3346571 RepID=UPI00366019AE
MEDLGAQRQRRRHPRVKRLLVTGSRNWTNRPIIYESLRLAWRHLQRDEPNDVPITLVHGAAQGADTIAAEMWANRSVWYGRRPPVEPHPADWDHCDPTCRHAPRYRRDGTRYCSAAGPRRNLEMIAAGADLCLAFPLGRSIGTQHCIRHARAAGIPVWEWGLGGRAS